MSLLVHLFGIWLEADGRLHLVTEALQINFGRSLLSRHSLLNELLLLRQSGIYGRVFGCDGWRKAHISAIGNQWLIRANFD